MITLLRFFIVAALTLIGYYFGIHYFSGDLLSQFPWLGAVFGFLSGLAVILIDLYFKRLTVRNILSVLLGAGLGFWVHIFLMNVIRYMAVPEEQVHQIGIVTAAIFAYLGAVTVLRGQDEFMMMIPFVKLNSKSGAEDIVLLDTSVIIDGRVADICGTAFLSG